MRRREKRGVFLVVAVIIKGDDMEFPKAGGQLSNGGNLDAHAVASIAVAFMLAILIQQFLDLHVSQ
jgi:hypothetical protein